MFSTPLLATDKEKTTLNWWEYWIGHCWMTGWQTIGINFRIWCDLMCSNYVGYGVFAKDDEEQECIDWFWVSIIADDVYPKQFLEDLMQMTEDVRTGKEELIPLDKNFFDRLKDLTDGVELDDDDL
jgi:hypothetical protein